MRPCAGLGTAVSHGVRVVDLTEVTFLSATTLGVLVNAAHTLLGTSKLIVRHNLAPPPAAS